MAEKQMKVFLNGILLPVPPEKITKSVKNQNKTLTTISGQEINLIRPAGLMEIVLSNLLLPNTPYDFMEASSDGKLAASYYLRIIDEFKKSKEAIILTINGSKDGLCADDESGSYKVTLEDYKATQSAENSTDVEVEIKFKQYVEYGLKKVPRKVMKKKTTVARTEKNTKEQTYTVQKGDTLWAIAKKFYGDGSLYPYLAKINNISNPNIIHTGQVLKIGNKAEAVAYKPPVTSTPKTVASSPEASSVEPAKTEKVVKTSTAASALGFEEASIEDRIRADADVVIEITKPLDILSPYGLAFEKSRQVPKTNIQTQKPKEIPKPTLNIAPVQGPAITVPKKNLNTGGGGGRGI